MSEKQSPKKEKARRASVESSTLKAIAVKCFPNLPSLAVTQARAEKRTPDPEPDAKENEEILKSVRSGWADCDLKKRFDDSVRVFLIK